MTHSADITDVKEKLSKFLSDNLDTLMRSDAADFIERAVDELNHDIFCQQEREIEEGIYDGSIPLPPTEYEEHNVWNKKHLGVF